MSDLDELLLDLTAGRYVPRPGTAGEVLLEAATDPGDPCDPCRPAALRSLQLFARQAYRHEGVWWLVALDSDPDSLTRWESDWMAQSWRAWMAGASPWRRGTRRVPA